MFRFVLVLYVATPILSMVLVGNKQFAVVKTVEESFPGCDDVLSAGYDTPGIYPLAIGEDVRQVACNFTTTTAGRNKRAVTSATTTILYRYYGQENFQRSFSDYRKGFGSAQTDYFLGLDPIRALIAKGNKVLTITLQAWNGETRTARYTSFSIGPNPDYALSVSGFSSANLKDDLSYQNGRKFATIDKVDTYGCALQQKAGWWYNYCAYTLLTGKYYPHGPYVPPGKFSDGIYWQSWLGYNTSLKYVAVTLGK